MTDDMRARAEEWLAKHREYPDDAEIEDSESAKAQREESEICDYLLQHEEVEAVVWTTPAVKEKLAEGGNAKVWADFIYADASPQQEQESDEHDGDS